MPEIARLNPPSSRLRSIDILRGAIMVLMAIDHVRVYSGIPAGGHTAGIFFTRWITHFCVSGFVFFAGTGAYLYGQKLKDRKNLSRFLLLRGLLLVLLELTIIRFFWTFNLDFKNFMLAGVIWMLGWCMVLLSGIIFLPFRVIWTGGLLLIIFQKIFGHTASSWRWWQFLYPNGEEGLSWINVLYVIVPWIGVMMAGYGFGNIMRLETTRRNRICRQIGLTAIALFLVAGCWLAYTSAHQNDMPFLFRLLNQQKYPPSQLFLLMTLGPLIALVPFAEKARGWLANALLIFGRVPLFYYLLHILLIHCSALLVNTIRTGYSLQDKYATAPFTGLPENQRWGLALLYLVFILVELILFIICRWYSKYKAQHTNQKWLKYL